LCAHNLILSKVVIGELHRTLYFEQNLIPKKSYMVSKCFAKKNIQDYKIFISPPNLIKFDMKVNLPMIYWYELSVFRN